MGKLASLQTSFQQLDEAMKVTNRRVNALDNVVIPKLENTMRYISSELDEREREDLFRLKKVVSKRREIIKLQKNTERLQKNEIEMLKRIQSKRVNHIREQCKNHNLCWMKCRNMMIQQIMLPMHFDIDTCPCTLFYCTNY